MSRTKSKSKPAAKKAVISPEKRSTLLNPIDAWLIDALGGGQTTASKQIVNAKSALNVPAWLCAIKAISEDVAKLPIGVYQKNNNDCIELDNHPLNYLLNVEPNTDMTALSYWTTSMSHALAWSGGYSEIIKDAGGRIIGLYPLDPTTVTPVRDNAGRLVYRVTMQGKFITFQQSDIFHIKGLSFDGIVGYDMANLAKEAIGNALAALKFSGAFFGNGANAGGVLTHPHSLKPEALTNLRESLANRYSGAENAHKLMVLEEGMTFTPTTIDPEKSNLIAQLKFGVDEIARIFRIPAHKLGSLDKATFSNIEEQNQNYIDETLVTWTLGISQEIRRKLLLPSEKSLEIKHNFSELLKGNKASQADYYGKLFMNGFITQNDAARKLGERQIGPLGDKYYRPSNVVPIDAPATPPAVAVGDAKPAAHPAGDLQAYSDAANAQKGQRAKETHSRLLASTLKRFLRLEKDKVQRYSKDFASEYKINEFYSDFKSQRSSEIEEILESYRVNSGIDFNVKTESLSILNNHIERSQAESKDIKAVESWLGSRADEVALKELNRIGGRNE